MIQFVCLSIHRSVRSRSVVKGKHWLMVIITDQHLQVAKNLLVQDVHYFVAQSYALKEGFSWCTNPCYLLRSTKIIICRPKKKYLNNQDCHRLCVAFAIGQDYLWLVIWKAAGILSKAFSVLMQLNSTGLEEMWVWFQIVDCGLFQRRAYHMSHTVQFSHSKVEQNKHFSYRKTILHQTSSKLWIRPLTYHDYVVQLFWGDTKVSPV